jgi:hypothetical protein
MVSEELVVVGVDVTTSRRTLRGSGAERWSGCLGLSLDCVFLLIVELRWVDPVFGQQRSILASSRLSLSLCRGPPKQNIANHPPACQRIANF